MEHYLAVSMIARRQSTEQVKIRGGSSTSGDNITLHNQFVNELSLACFSSNLYFNIFEVDDCSNKGNVETSPPAVEVRKKARQSRLSQLSLTSFFQKSSSGCETSERTCNETKINQTDIYDSSYESNGASTHFDESSDLKECESDVNASPAEEEFAVCEPSQKEKSNAALLEWQRIQQLMQNSIPLCKGHKQPCVARIVKKAGPNFGRRFYVCARAEVFTVDNNCFTIIIYIFTLPATSSITSSFKLITRYVLAQHFISVKTFH